MNEFFKLTAIVLFVKMIVHPTIQSKIVTNDTSAQMVQWYLLETSLDFGLKAFSGKRTSTSRLIKSSK